MESNAKKSGLRYRIYFNTISNFTVTKWQLILHPLYLGKTVDKSPECILLPLNEKSNAWLFTLANSGSQRAKTVN
jgi:hypothetical protein